MSIIIATVRDISYILITTVIITTTVACMSIVIATVRDIFNIVITQQS